MIMPCSLKMKKKTYFSNYFIPKVEIKDFNILLNGKSFFDIETKFWLKKSKNNDYTVSNLLCYEYFWNSYKLIAIYLSKQTELENPELKRQINLLVSLKEIMVQQCYLSLKNHKKQLLNFRKIL